MRVCVSLWCALLFVDVAIAVAVCCCVVSVSVYLYVRVHGTCVCDACMCVVVGGWVGGGSTFACPSPHSDVWQLSHFSHYLTYFLHNCQLGILALLVVAVVVVLFCV